MATISSWPICKFDFDSAFLQSGVSTRNAYVNLSNQCTSRRKFLLHILKASYGLVNAKKNGKQAVMIVCMSIDYRKYLKFLNYSTRR